MKTTNKGFTLLELLVGIGIVGILAAISYPIWRDWILNAKYREAARNVASALNETRARAITTNAENDLEIDIDNRHYWMSQGGTTVRDYGTFSADVKIATGTDSTCSTTTGDGSAASDYTIQLYPNGTSGSSDTDQFYVCVLDANGNRKYQARMRYHATGRVKIVKWNTADSAWE